jgi:nucleoside-diphosphate-sugar epimerase
MPRARRSILILGGSYFIGRHVARELAGHGHQVTLLNRGTRNVDRLPVLQADRNDPAQMRQVLAGLRFDVVIDTSCYEPAQAVIAESALSGRYARWLFLSTAAVYADDAPRPLAPTSRLAGLSAFGDLGRKKLGAERLLLEACGPRATVIRPAYVYGPDNSLARETALWSRMLTGRPVFLPGDGATRATFSYVLDVAQAIRHIVEADVFAGQAYNIGHPEPVTLCRLVETLASAANLFACIHRVPEGTLGLDARQYFPYRALDLSLDVSDLARDVALPEPTSLLAGLSATYQHYGAEALKASQRSSSVELELSVALGLVA